MKLLFVLPEYGRDFAGGVATYYRHLLPHLVDAGCTIDVCVADERGQTEATADASGINRFEVATDAIARARESLSQFAAVPLLRNALAVAVAAWDRCGRGEGYDVVETTDWGLLYAPWLAADGPPVVVQLHGSNGQIDYHDPSERRELSGTVTRILEAALLGRADELQSYGQTNAEQWSSLLDRPVRHIPPGWNAEAEEPALPDYAGIENVGIAVGRLQSWKGPEVLCAALDRLGERAPTVIWVGRDTPFRKPGQFMSEHLARAFPRVWARSFRHVGERAHAATAGLQAAAKFAVVPSSWDVFNLAAVEAMAAGRAVICSDGAGAARLIRHGENGFRVPPGDVAALARSIEEVANLPAAARNRIGDEARATVRSALDPKRNAATRMERYRALAAGRMGRRQAHRWLDTLFAPENGGSPLGFLHSIPLRELAPHVLGRTAGRLLNRR